MNGGTVFEGPRRQHVSKIRAHDYLYDSMFIVSGAKDYARTAFRAAMASAQLIIQPIYKTMFSDLRTCPRMQVVYHANCRLPEHLDRSYGAYVERVSDARSRAPPQLAGRDRFKFATYPKQVLPLSAATPDFHPSTPVHVPPLLGKPRTRGTQSVYRESSAQTIPWQPDGKPAEQCDNVPEVLYLDKLEWGPGKPYRWGDLPADFHTTEIINKMRHARKWTEVAERGQFPRWMKKRDEIIGDVETKDWIFREAEIDELQDIRLSLLHRLQSQQRGQQTSKTSRKLAKLWASKKQEMERKIDKVRRSRDRELRKLTSLHESGGRTALAQRQRSARAMGNVTVAAHDPLSDVHAPVRRHGYQARGRHADIVYDPSLLALEDHTSVAAPPAWLEQCGTNLKRTCSGHHLPLDPMSMCERETKWSEEYLASLHNDLKKARMGAVATSAGPLHVLKPRRLAVTPRPATPEVEAVPENEEANHQAALLLQKIIRGRAVQCLMYEGRTRAAELTEELKTTHGLQLEDKIRIAREEAKARDYNALRTEAEQKEDAITALVDELCGGAVSSALDFLEKELRRLKEERRQHAFILIAIREKAMREAAEAGRRQKEEHRRREHDEMFKQVLGVTQETVDAYLRSIIEEGVTLGAEIEATRRAQVQADRIDESLANSENMSTAEQNELVAELVQQFLLPVAHKTAARHRIAAQQQAKMDAARQTIFGLVDEAQIKKPFCIRCGTPLDELCRCRVCPITPEPVETTSRDDPRWKYSRRRAERPEKPIGERYPPAHEFRCMLDTLIDEVADESRRHLAERADVRREVGQRVRERVEVELDAKEILDTAIDLATGKLVPPVRVADYRHYMRRIIPDAMERTQPPATCLCPPELPSAIRRRAEEKAAAEDCACRCVTPPLEDADAAAKVQFDEQAEGQEKPHLLPTVLRALEELRRCKCDDTSPTETSPGAEWDFDDTSYTYSDTGAPSTAELADEQTDPADQP